MFHEAQIVKSYAEMVLEEHVENGIEFLDKHQPDWYTKVDLSNLDMSSGKQCICGYVFAGMMSGIYNGYDTFVSMYGSQDPQALGFVYDPNLMVDDKDYMGPTEQYSFLAELWAPRIEKRLAEEGKMA